MVANNFQIIEKSFYQRFHRTITHVLAQWKAGERHTSMLMLVHVCESQKAEALLGVQSVGLMLVSSPIYCVSPMKENSLHRWLTSHVALLLLNQLPTVSVFPNMV